jgi:hypothetical protein
MARLSIDDALDALAMVDDIAAAFVETAPDAAVRIGGAEGIVARCEMTAIGPMPKFTIDEWSEMALEHAAMQKPEIAGHLPQEP